jgi:hypothetical protein
MGQRLGFSQLLGLIRCKGGPNHRHRFKPAIGSDVPSLDARRQYPYPRKDQYRKDQDRQDSKFDSEVS